MSDSDEITGCPTATTQTSRFPIFFPRQMPPVRVLTVIYVYRHVRNVHTSYDMYAQRDLFLQGTPKFYKIQMIVYVKVNKIGKNVRENFMNL